MDLSKVCYVDIMHDGGHIAFYDKDEVSLYDVYCYDEDAFRSTINYVKKKYTVLEEIFKDGTRVTYTEPKQVVNI